MRPNGLISIQLTDRAMTKEHSFAAGRQVSQFPTPTAIMLRSTSTQSCLFSILRSSTEKKNVQKA